MDQLYSPAMSVNKNSEPRVAAISRRRWRALRICLFSILLPLVIGEIAVRSFTDTKRPRLVVDSRVGRRYVPGFEGRRRHPESGREIEYRFNSEGMRFGDLPKQKPSGTRRLALIGDSMIAGLEVQEEETTVALLQELLAETRPGEHWEVLNFGVSGSGTGQQFVLYQELASQYQPDIVLCAFFVGNDFSDNNTRLSHRKQINFDLDEAGELVKLPFPSLRERFNEILNEYCRLYVWQKRAIAKAKAKVVWAENAPDGRHAWHGDRIRVSEWVYFTGEDETTDYGWRVTRKLIHSLAEEVRGDGGEFAMVMMPSADQVHDEDFEYLRKVAGELAELFDPANPGARLAEICDEVDAPFIDLLPALRLAAPSHSYEAKDEWLFYKGIGHLNPAGHRVVAQALLDGLARVIHRADVVR